MKILKVQNSKFGLFDKSNVHFRYFSWRKNKSVLKWFLGNFKCFNFSQIQKSPKLPKGGGGGGGGQEECGFFPLFVAFFNSNASLRGPTNFCIRHFWWMSVSW